MFTKVQICIATPRGGERTIRGHVEETVNMRYTDIVATGCDGEIFDHF